MNLNQCFLEENLVADPIVSSVGDKTLAKFSIACNRLYRRDHTKVHEVSYFDVFAWERTAELCGQFLKKGRLVRIIGHLKQDRWNGTGGKPRSKVTIICTLVDFIGHPRKTDDGKDGAAQDAADTALLDAENASPSTPEDHLE